MTETGDYFVDEDSLIHPSEMMKFFKHESVVVCRNAALYINVFFHIENSREIGRLRKYTVDDFIMSEKFYVQYPDIYEKCLDELIALNELVKTDDDTIYRLYTQKIKWSESEGTDNQHANITPGTLKEEARTLLDENPDIQSYQWRKLYFGFAEFARYACLQGDFYAIADRFYTDWVAQLTLIFNPDSKDIDRMHILRIVMAQILSEINGYYLHKDKIERQVKYEKDYMYIFQKQERVRLYFLQQFLEQKRRNSIRNSRTDASLREFPLSAHQWWDHYYPDNDKYEGDPNDINIQYKRDIQAAELDHLVIMELLYVDLRKIISQTIANCTVY